MAEQSVGVGLCVQEGGRMTVRYISLFSGIECASVEWIFRRINHTKENKQ